MDDILSRLGNVEKSVAKIEATLPHLATAESVARIDAIIPLLATAESVARIEAIIPLLATSESVSKIAAVIPHLATAASVADLKGTMESKLSAMESKITRWFVGTAIALTTLAFSIAKFVH